MDVKACFLLIVATASLAVGCGQHPQRVFAVQVAAAPAATTARPASAKAAVAMAMPTGELVGFHPSHSKRDLNAAPLSELETIPGLSPRLAAALVAGRPYTAKRELMKRGLLTEEQYARWKDYLIVHRTRR